MAGPVRPLVRSRQSLHAALWLVVALGGLAIEYLLLTAEFIAWVQVLIYLGSVVVLVLFGLMFAVLTELLVSFKPAATPCSLPSIASTGRCAARSSRRRAPGPASRAGRARRRPGPGRARC